MKSGGLRGKLPNNYQRFSYKKSTTYGTKPKEISVTSMFMN